MVVSHFSVCEHANFLTKYDLWCLMFAELSINFLVHFQEHHLAGASWMTANWDRSGWERQKTTTYLL